MRPFLELYKHNFGKELRKKPTFYKGADGKLAKNHESKWLEYVEWATVLVALYHVGKAEKVEYYSEVHPTKRNTLIIHLNIDGVEYLSHYPIIDGNTIIDNPNQMQIHKAELRGFVKCVAINTGLGLSLWQKEESHLNELPPIEDKPKEQVEDNTILFLEWDESLKSCQNIDELGKLYNSNKEVVEGHSYIKALFIKRKTELTKK